MIVLPKDEVLSTLKGFSNKQLKAVERAIHRSLAKKEPLTACLAREEFVIGDKVSFLTARGEIKTGVLRKMNPLYARVWVAKEERLYKSLPKNLKIINKKNKETMN